jgi:hypothetical protein
MTAIGVYGFLMGFIQSLITNTWFFGSFDLFDDVFIPMLGYFIGTLYGILLVLIGHTPDSHFYVVFFLFSCTASVLGHKLSMKLKLAGNAELQSVSQSSFATPVIMCVIAIICNGIFVFSAIGWHLFDIEIRDSVIAFVLTTLIPTCFIFTIIRSKGMFTQTLR